MNRWWVLAAVVTLVSVVAELAFRDASHFVFWWHAVPAFDFVYGTAGCLAMIVLSRALGKVWLQRGEGYYDEERR